jgi:hypothetical protein
MTSEFASTFASLRSILQRNSGTLFIKTDTPECYCLEGRAGPATLRAWGGKLKQPMISVAWVQIGKACVSYHLMGIYGNTRLRDRMSKELKARMKGKACFNFTAQNEALFKELEQLTGQAIAGFRRAGFTSD